MERPLIFGACRLNPDGLLTTPKGDRQLTRLHAEILRMLVEARSIAVSSEALVDACWGSGKGSPQALAKSIYQLRHSLQCCEGLQIESVYGYGYRLRMADSDQRHPDPEAIAAAICEEAGHRLAARDETSVRTSQAMYEQAMRLDSSCLQALLGYAEARFQSTVSGWEPAVLTWPAVQGAIREAMHLAPNSAEAMAYQGLGEAVFDWDFARSGVTFRTALKLAPVSYVVNYFAGRAALYQGDGRSAIDRFRVALQASPMALSAHGMLAFALTSVGRDKEARTEVLRTQRLDPSSSILTSYFAWLESAYGDPAAGVRRVGSLVDKNPGSSVAVALSAFAFARAGQAAPARALLRTLSDPSRYPAPDCALVCMAWLALGEPEAALDALERAAQARDYWFGPMLFHPLNEPLRALPRFQALQPPQFRKLRGQASGAA